MTRQYLPDPLEVGKDLRKKPIAGLSMFFINAGNFGDEVAEYIEFPDRNSFHIGASYERLQISYTKMKSQNTENPLEHVVNEVMNFAEQVKKGLDSKAPTTLEDAQYLDCWVTRVNKARKGEYSDKLNRERE